MHQVEIGNNAILHEYLRGALHAERGAALPPVRRVAPECIPLEQDQLLSAPRLYELVGPTWEMTQY